MGDAAGHHHPEPFKMCPRGVDHLIQDRGSYVPFAYLAPFWLMLASVIAKKTRKFAIK